MEVNNVIKAVIWPSQMESGGNFIGRSSGLVADKRWASSPKALLKADDEDAFGYLGHVLTWHDLELPKHGNYRVWVHSLSRSKIRRDFFSMEIQKHGSVFNAITTDEANIRLQLANLLTTWGGEGALKSSLLRELPSGHLLEEHARTIDKFLMTLLETADNVIDFNSLSGRAKGVSKNHKNGEIKFRSTLKDSILLAKLYAIRSESATNSRVAKRVCDELGIDTSVLYTAVRVARSKGWMTEGKKGIAGGTMTSEGEKYFLENDGPARLETITGIKIGN